MTTIAPKWPPIGSSKTDSPIVYYTYVITPIGKLLLSASHGKLIGLHIEGQKNFPIIGGHWQHNQHICVLTKAKVQLNEYFNGKRDAFEIDYKLYGTDLQINTWKSLEKISYGEVATYKAFAALAAYPHAIRAVASAIGKNPLSIVLPCHRVIRSDGSLGGYGGGIAVKQRLLTLEGGQ